jgi:hypothetical protein
MSTARSDEFAFKKASRRQGAGRKNAEHWKLDGTAAIGGGSANALISALSMHAMMDTYVGVVTLQVARRVVLSTMTADVTRPGPIRQAYLFVGFRRVSPRFFKLWRITTLLFASNPRTAMLASLVIVVSFVALGATWAHAWVKTLVFLLLALLVVREAK